MEKKNRENNLIILSVIILGISLFLYINPALATEITIPPTNAFSKILTDAGNILAKNYDSALTVKGSGTITISANNTSNTLTIFGASTNSSTGSENTTASNIGSGKDIFAGISSQIGGNIPFRSLTNDSSISVIQNTNDIALSVPGLTNKIRSFNQSIHGTTSNATVYYTINDIDQSSSTESLTDTKIGFSCTLQRLGFHVTGNAKINPFTLSFRINGVSYGTITVNGGQTGYFETTGINQKINAGDKINFQLNALAAGTGSLTIRGIMAECQ